MDGKYKKPEIRFTGFTDAWKQWELGEIGETYTGLSGKTKDDFGHGDGKYITYMNVFSNPVANPSIVEPIEIDVKQNEVKAGDVFFTTSSEIPDEVGMSSVWLENSNNTYLNSFCFGYRPTEKFDSYYLAYMLRSFSVRKKITFLAQGISRYNISKNKVMEITVPIPSIKEQSKIGTFFKHLDNLITFHQCKNDKLIIVKKSMLQKLFPKDGTDVPEVRFAGFTDAWLKRELSEYLDTSNVKNSNDDFSKNDVLSVSGDLGIINQIEFQGRSFAGASVSNYGIVDSGDVVYTKSPLKANPYGIIKENKGKPGIVSTLYAVYKPKKNVNSNFVQYYFDYDYRLNKYLNPLVNKGAKNDMKVSDENALTGLVIFPSYEEQTRIAEFLECLDNLISLHRREVEKLKNIKSAMLEKMFV